MNLKEIVKFDQESLINFYEANKKYILGITGAYLSLQLLKRFYFAGGVCKSKRRLDGKTVIITGANTGIGKETAIDLAKRGARVILACRDLKRAQEAVVDVRKKSANANVVVEHLDLASLSSVRSFAQRVLSQEKRIDILINNAGMIKYKFIFFFIKIKVLFRHYDVPEMGDYRWI